MKLLHWLLLGALGLLLAGLAALTFYVNEIVGSAIERGGSYALGVDTRVGLVRLSLLTGSLRMSRLRIGNPAGFAGDHFLTLGGARLDVQMDTLRESTVEMPLIELSDVDVVLTKKDRRTNADAILAHMRSLEASGRKQGPGGEGGAGGKQLVVGQLVIRDVTARVQLYESLGEASIVPLEIAEIRLTNVGRGRKLTTAELSNIIVKTIMTAIAKQGVGVLPAAVLSGVAAGLGRLSGVPGKLVTDVGAQVGGVLPEVLAEPLGQAGETGRAAVEGAGRAVGEGAGRALRGLGGLLGREEPEE